MSALAGVLSSVLDSIVGILGAVATAISENAEVVATVLVVGALAFVVIRYGSRMMRGITSWFKGMF